MKIFKNQFKFNNTSNKFHSFRIISKILTRGILKKLYKFYKKYVIITMNLILQIKK